MREFTRSRAVGLTAAMLVVCAGVQGLTQQPSPPSGRGSGQQQTKPAPQAPQPQMPALPAPATAADADKPALVVPPPLYPTTPAIDKQITYERIYRYRQMTYKPPIVIQPITRDAATNATPEQAFGAQISAMLTGDYDWWLSNWDQASQKFHKERNQQMNRTPADWRGTWDRALKGQQVRLTDRLVTGPFGPYVMLLYEMHDPSGKLTLKSSFVAKEEAGRWVATLDLSEDPLFQYHDIGKDRVTVTVR